MVGCQTSIHSSWFCSPGLHRCTLMEQFFDFIFGIAWCQWLAGVMALATAYYAFAASSSRTSDGSTKPTQRRANSTKRRKRSVKRRASGRNATPSRAIYPKKIPTGSVTPVQSSARHGPGPEPAHRPAAERGIFFLRDPPRDLARPAKRGRFVRLRQDLP